MSKKKISVRFQTPVIELSYIHAVKPDLKYGPTYQVTGNMPEAEGLAMVAAMESQNPAFKGKIPYKLADGTVTFKVKQKRYISWFDANGTKQERESIPTLLNSDQSPFTGAENPWSGTTGEIAMTIDLTKDQQGNPTVALRLVGIRFHEVKVGGAGGSNDPLFGGNSKEKSEPELDAPEDSVSFDDDIPF